MIIIVAQIVILAIVMVIVSRQTLHEELDDVHPYILDIDDPYLQRSKWLWVIPLYMNEPISNHPEWVQYIKNTGKHIGLHGVHHTYREFATDRSDEYIDKGIEEFTRAFGYYPTHFKAPSLALSENNRRKIIAKGMGIKSHWNQIIHRVYHSPNNRTANGRLIGET